MGRRNLGSSEGGVAGKDSGVILYFVATSYKYKEETSSFLPPNPMFNVLSILMSSIGWSN